MAEMRIDLLRDQLAMSQAHISPLASTVAALVAERDRLVAINADLVAALRAMLVMMDRGPKPEKLDEALSWRQCDERARAMAVAALAKSAP